MYQPMALELRSPLLSIIFPEAMTEQVNAHSWQIKQDEIIIHLCQVSQKRRNPVLTDDRRASLHRPKGEEAKEIQEIIKDEITYSCVLLK